MINSTQTDASPWQQMATSVLAGNQLNKEDGIRILESNDDELLDLLAATYRVRKHYFGNEVQLYLLMNAKSGLCAEDCGYCSQSKVSDAEVPKYNFLSRDKLMDGAKVAAENQAGTYCIVISGRSPTEREMEAVSTIVPEIKEKYGLKICACLGLLNDDQAEQLKACGVDRVNHNLNTSAEHYDEICTTHTHQDRLDTLKAVKDAGLEMCSGGIMGMGEKQDDVVSMAIELRELKVDSIPVNFLNPVEGTPLSEQHNLTPRDCLRILCVYRMFNPDREIRIAGGREIHLRSLQPMGLYAANSIFLGDYLTTKGQLPETDYHMIEDLGFTIAKQQEVATACKSESQA